MLGSLGAFGTLGVCGGVLITSATLSTILDILDKKVASEFVKGLGKFIVYGITFYVLGGLCINIIRDYHLFGLIKGGAFSEFVFRNWK